MTTEQKIGQHLAVGFAGTTVPESLRQLVRQYKIGNIILFRGNLEREAQAKELCDALSALVEKETGHPPFITIDQEGGVVTRLPQEMVNVPGAMALAASGDAENAYLAARLTAAELARIGVNFNLAPVLDINTNPENPAIGVRSYGDLPETVTRFANAAIAGYADTGVLCCGKHFPGHGSTSVDSHLALPVVDRSFSQLETTDFAPFAAAVKAGIPAMMTTHILFPQLETQRVPATMSRKIITGLLKETMGFQGLVLSDGMEMNAIKEEYGTPEGCVRAIAAGVDIVFVCHDPVLMEQSAQAVARAYTEGIFDLAEFERSTQKIIDHKARQRDALQIFRHSVAQQSRAESRACNEKLMQKTISLVGETTMPDLGSAPYFAGCLAYRSTIASSAADTAVNFPRWFAQRLGGRAATTSLDPQEAEILSAVSGVESASSVVVGCYNGRFHPGQIRLANALAQAAAHRGIPAVAVALRDPYELRYISPHVCRVAAFEYSETCFQALLNLFQGTAVPSGKLEVVL